MGAAAAKALAEYESKLKETEATAAKEVAAVMEKVKEAKDALKNSQDELADTKKTRDAAVEKKISPLIKKKDLTGRISKKLEAKAEDAHSAKLEAAEKWKGASEKLAEYYVEVKKWKETLV